MFFCRSHLLCRCHQTYTCIFLTKTGVPILVMYQARHGSTHVHAEMKYAAAMPIFRHVHRKMPVSKWTTLSWHEYLINIARHVLGQHTTDGLYLFVWFFSTENRWLARLERTCAAVSCPLVFEPHILSPIFLNELVVFLLMTSESWIFHDFSQLYIPMYALTLDWAFFSSNCYLLSCWAIFLLANTPLYALL